MTTNTYGNQCKLNVPFADAEALVTEALKKEGFGVLTKIDMKAKLKEKLNVDFREYVILGACNPALAYDALQEELDLGLLLPCNVIIYETDSGCIVSAIDAAKMLSVAGNPKLAEVAEMVNGKLQRAINSI